MVLLRCAVPLSHHPAGVCAVHDRTTRGFGEDCCGDPAPYVLDPACYSPVLPSLSSDSDMAYLLLLMPVSVDPPLILQGGFQRFNACYPWRIVLIEMSLRFVPSEWRPHIWVKVLPALENIFYGANLSNILSAHQNSVLDILAGLPYGITHYGAPFVCSGILFIFGPPGTVPVFARSFGYMNIIGVMIQMLFPCSPPWYENLYGLAPANYSMAGSPAGLARLDELFGLDIYTSAFTASPMVFGAFPSLHSGSATIEALFMSHVFPQLQPLFIAYTLWLWWATMYLSHHYAVDLVGGSLSKLFGMD